MILGRARNKEALPQRSEGVPVLEVDDLNVRFGSEDGVVHAVRGVNFTLNAGEVMGLVGESGSGKSVTSLSVMGLLDANAKVTGSVKLHGTELLGRSDAYMSRIRGDQMGMVFQDPLSALTPVYTIGTQIVEALTTHKQMEGGAAEKRAVELLDLVGIPNAATRVKSFPHEFSGGMRQRAMIAMAVANDPDLIIADEPTTALDVTIQAQILEVLKTAQYETGAAVILITHDLGVVAGIANKMAVMYAGRIVEHGDLNDIYYRTAMPYTIGLLGSLPRPDRAEKIPLAPVEGNPPSLLDLPPGCPFAPRCPLAVDDCLKAEPVLEPVDGTDKHTVACIRANEINTPGMDFRDIYPVPDVMEGEIDSIPRQDREVVLDVDNLKKYFPLMKGAIFKRRVGTVHAVDDISLEIRQGEVLGLVGESGCGKTTTLMEILDLKAPESGKIVVLGKDTSKMKGSERRTTREDIQVVFQDPMASLDPRMPVFDLIAEPMNSYKWSKDKIEDRVVELMTLVGLEPSHANRYPQHFSGGQRQRIGIARALALNPSLLVLDEPVSALDVSIQAGVINLLDDLRGRLGLSYLFVAHDLSVVRHIADRVAVMYLGKIVEIGDIDSVFDTPTHPYTQALLSAIPIPDPEKERSRSRILLEGDLPSPANPPSGCRFRTRCPKFKVLTEEEQQKCIDVLPEMLTMGTDHESACHYAEQARVL